ATTRVRNTAPRDASKGWCPSLQARSMAAMCSAAGTAPPAADQARRMRPPPSGGSGTEAAVAGAAGALAAPVEWARGRAPPAATACARASQYQRERTRRLRLSRASTRVSCGAKTSRTTSGERATLTPWAMGVLLLGDEILVDDDAVVGAEACEGEVGLVLEAV